MNNKEALRAAQEAQDMLHLLEKLQRIDLDKVKLEERNLVAPMDRLIDDLKNNRKVQTRVLKGREGNGRKPKPKVHWQVKKKKRQAYYENYRKPTRSRRKAEMLSTPEGWYKYLMIGWVKKKVEVELTLDQWRDTLWPAIGGRLFVIFRYNVNGPISLDNIYLLDSDTREVIFDGKEHRMRELGHIL